VANAIMLKLNDLQRRTLRKAFAVEEGFCHSGNKMGRGAEAASRGQEAA
jgi:hypothetical protein